MGTFTRRPKTAAGDAGPGWRFDAIDLRAGLAFTSWRDDLADTKLPADAPLLHFAPPSFVPEPVANIALALGATRGSMRPGLLIGEREATFATPGEVGEFLRRAYVNGGGGDGSDDGGEGEGGGDEGPPPPERDEREPPRDEAGPNRPGESPAAIALVTTSKRFQDQIARLPGGQSAPFSWRSSERVDGVQALRNGAIQVFRELLLRRPTSQRGPAAADMVRWQQGFKAWCGLVGTIGLWPIMLDARDRELRWLLHDRIRRLSVMPHVPEAILDAVAWHLLAKGDDEWHRWPDLWQWEYDHLRRYGWSRLSIEMTAPRHDSPVAALKRLPLPRWASTNVGAGLQRRASLYHLLCSVLGSPIGLLGRQSELLLFAAAGLVASSVSTYDEVFSTPWLSRSYGEATDVQKEEVRRVWRETASWLAEHLPARAFAGGYETVIGGVKDRRYRET